MRTLTNTFGTAAAHAAGEREAILELQDLSYAVGDPAQAELEHVARRSPVSTAVRIVGGAMGARGCIAEARVQGLVETDNHADGFLLHVEAGAATTAKKAEFNPALQLSNYEPTKTRDPFTRGAIAGVEAKLPSGVPIVFQLDGILYQTTNPSAIVNGQLVG